MKLPDLVPFNDPVTVCANCRKACCLVQYHLRCGNVSDVVQVPLADVQAAALEHQSYWKGSIDGDPDMPDDIAELEGMIRRARERAAVAGFTNDREITRDYILNALGIDADQVNAAMAKEWP